MLERLVRGRVSRGPLLAALAVGTLTIVVCLVRIRFLMASPYPLGIDGYFYPIQLRSLLETGHLYYPSSPGALWLLLPIATVADPITAAKIGAAIGTGLAPIPFYLLGLRLTGRRSLGLLCAAIVAISPASFYLCTEFVKEGIGITVAAAFSAAIGSFAAKKTWRAGIAALFFWTGAMLVHKTAAVLTAFVGLPVLATMLAAHLRGRARSPYPWPAVLALTLVLVVLVLFLTLGLTSIVSSRSTNASSLAHCVSLSGTIRSQPDWTLPTLAIPSRERLRFGHEPALAVMASLLLLGIVGSQWVKSHPKTAIVTTSAARLRRAERVAALHQFGGRPGDDAPRSPSSERRGGGEV
ncbi:MAG: glycosyltransferase family 39 protein, partial [Pseudomonadota bacterium]